MRTRSAKLSEVTAAARSNGNEWLDMTLRELLLRVVGVPTEEEWVNIRDERYPWRHIVAAAERGECQVSRVGRKLLMHRDELSAFLRSRCIKGGVEKKGEPATKPKGEFDAVVRRMLERNGMI